MVITSLFDLRGTYLAKYHRIRPALHEIRSLDLGDHGWRLRGHTFSVSNIIQPDQKFRFPQSADVSSNKRRFKERLEMFGVCADIPRLGKLMKQVPLGPPTGRETSYNSSFLFLGF